MKTDVFQILAAAPGKPLEKFELANTIPFQLLDQNHTGRFETEINLIHRSALN